MLISLSPLTDVAKDLLVCPFICRQRYLTALATMCAIALTIHAATPTMFLLSRCGSKMLSQLKKGNTMKSILIAATMLTASISAMAADVGVSINIGQPGFYGRIDIGSFPQPQLLYAQPMIIERQTRYVEQPIYLRVPPGHAKKWSKHCRAYNACGQRVYFVQDDWYNNVYAPQYRERHDERRDYRSDNRNNDNRDYRDDNRGHGRDKDEGDNRGRGNSGKGHDKGRDKD